MTNRQNDNYTAVMCVPRSIWSTLCALHLFESPLSAAYNNAQGKTLYSITITAVLDIDRST